MALQYFLVTLGLLVAELIYFRIATRFDIVDKPNIRSSHSIPTIRGGGVTFAIAVIGWWSLNGQTMSLFVSAVILIAAISFVDDLRSVPAWLRFVVQVAGISLLFLQVPMSGMSWWLLALAFVICVGAINAFNFMDGINGITGVYSLVTLLTFAWVDTVTHFIDLSLIFFLIAAVAVFLFFNFRKRAVCFAGDVGSTTIALVQIFLLLQLIHATENFLWVILFLVFGVDSVITIVHRIARKENIFAAHRTHLYQYLSNELGWSHLTVSVMYGVLQGILNAVVIVSFITMQAMIAIGVSVLFIMGYITIRAFAIKAIKLRQASR